MSYLFEEGLRPSHSIANVRYEKEITFYSQNVYQFLEHDSIAELQIELDPFSESSLGILKRRIISDCENRAKYLTSFIEALQFLQIKTHLQNIQFMFYGLLHPHRVEWAERWREEGSCESKEIEQLLVLFLELFES